MIRVHIASPLRRTFNPPALGQVEARSVRERVDRLDERYPGIGDRLLEPDG